MGGVQNNLGKYTTPAKYGGNYNDHVIVRNNPEFDKCLNVLKNIHNDLDDMECDIENPFNKNGSI